MHRSYVGFGVRLCQLLRDVLVAPLMDRAQIGIGALDVEIDFRCLDVRVTKPRPGRSPCTYQSRRCADVLLGRANPLAHEVNGHGAMSSARAASSAVSKCRPKGPVASSLGWLTRRGQKTSDVWVPSERRVATQTPRFDDHPAAENDQPTRPPRRAGFRPARMGTLDAKHRYQLAEMMERIARGEDASAALGLKRRPGRERDSLGSRCFGSPGDDPPDLHSQPAKNITSIL